MALDPYTKLGLWSGNVLGSITNWVQSLLGHSSFTPEVSLAEAKGIDPRLVPKVPMQSSDIDTNLLIELSKLGMKHGKLVSEQSHPELMGSWKVMSARAGFKHPPQLIIVESKTINAMTVSPEEVVMTTGLLKKLDLREVCAVLGHELGHAASDHKRPRIAATVAFGGAGAYAGHKVWEDFGKPAYLKRRPGAQHSELALSLVSMSIGSMLGGMVANQVSVKPTELQADLRGAAISGDPMGLVSALQKLESSRTRSPITNALAHLQSGYPTTHQRIENLKRVAVQMPVHPAGMPVAVFNSDLPPLKAPATQPSPQVSSISADVRVGAEASAQASLS